MNREEPRRPPRNPEEERVQEPPRPGRKGMESSKTPVQGKTPSGFSGVPISAELDTEEAAFLGRIKIDLDTPLEKLFTYSMWSSLMLAYFCFHGGVFGGKHSPPDPALLKGIPMFLAAAMTFYFLRQATDNYYVVDVRGRRVLYHFRLLVWESMKPAFSFTDILAVAMISLTCHSKHSTWEEYRLQVVRSNGEIVHFSDWDKDRYVIHSRGEKLVALIGCPFEVGAVDEKAAVGWHPTGDPYLSWESATESSNRIVLYVLGFFIFILFFFLLAVFL